MNITYRVSDIKDAKELKRLNDEFNGENSNTEEGIREALILENAETVFVAEAEGKLVGFCCGQLLRSICYRVSYTKITELYVEEDFQKKGIGKGLVNFAEDWYRQREVHDFQLFTGSENLNAQKFYKGIGYRRSDEILYRKRDWWRKDQGEEV